MPLFQTRRPQVVTQQRTKAITALLCLVLRASQSTASKGRAEMLRARKKDCNLKPNRRLDKRSSRGMLYENEELRMRTIEINAEVDRSQTDVKKLKRENDQLRREMWVLRDECSKLEDSLQKLDVTGDDEKKSDSEEEDNRENLHKLQVLPEESRESPEPLPNPDSIRRDSSASSCGFSGEKYATVIRRGSQVLSRKGCTLPARRYSSCSNRMSARNRGGFSTWMFRRNSCVVLDNESVFQSNVISGGNPNTNPFECDEEPSSDVINEMPPPSVSEYDVAGDTSDLPLPPPYPIEEELNEVWFALAGSLNDVTPRDAIDELLTQCPVGELIGIRITDTDHCSLMGVSVLSSNGVKYLNEKGVRLRGQLLRRVSEKPESWKVHLLGVPEDVSDTTLQSMLSPIGSLEVERRIYRGVYTGERSIRVTKTPDMPTKQEHPFRSHISVQLNRPSLTRSTSAAPLTSTHESSPRLQRTQSAAQNLVGMPIQQRVAFDTNGSATNVKRSLSSQTSINAMNGSIPTSNGTAKQPMKSSKAYRLLGRSLSLDPGRVPVETQTSVRSKKRKDSSEDDSSRRSSRSTRTGGSNSRDKRPIYSSDDESDNLPWCGCWGNGC